MSTNKKTGILKAGALGLALAFSITSVVPQYTVWAQPSEAESGEDTYTAAETAMTLMPKNPATAEEAVQVAEATKLYEALSDEDKDKISPALRAKLLQAQTQAGVVNRTSGDVTVSGDLPWYVQLTVEKSEDTSAPSAYTVLAPYEMHLTNLLDGSDYGLNGQAVTVSIPKPEGSYGEYKILHYLDDGSIEYITPAETDGRLEFQTTSFSLFKLGGVTEIVGGTHHIYEDAVRPDDTQGSTSSPADTGTGTGTSTNKGGSSKPSNSSSSGGKNTSSKNTGSSVGKVPLTGDKTKLWIYGAGCAASLLAGLGILVHMDLEKKRSRKMEQ